MAKNYKVMSKLELLTKRITNMEYVELENGSGVFVKEMNGTAIEVIAKLQSGPNASERNIEAMAKVIALSVCDEQGNLIFDLGDWESIIENNTISTLTKLSQTATRVSKLNPESVEEAKKNLKNA